MLPDGGGNIYVTGTDFAGNDPLGEGDIVTIKYNPLGSQQWVARFNGATSESDGATGIAADADGNSYVTGSTRISGINTDYVTIKYNTDGTQLWMAQYGGAAAQGDTSAAITIDNSGNVYVLGTDQKIPYDYDYLTIKYSSTGQTQWTVRYDGKGHGNDWPASLDVDQSGNVYVTGQSIGSNYTWDIATVKYSASGVKQWAKTYDGTGHGDDIGNAVKVDQSGNVYVGGATAAGSSNLNYTTIKYNSLGHKDELPDSGNDEANTLLQNYPNPFSSSTTICYHLCQSSNVTFIIRDVTGIIVKQLNFPGISAGNHSIELNGDGLASGIYFCEMVSGDFTNMRRLVLQK